MTDLTRCSQSGCKNDAIFKYTWPGKDQSGICLECGPKLLGVAKAIGLHLQLLPLSIEDYRNRKETE